RSNAAHSLSSPLYGRGCSAFRRCDADGALGGRGVYRLSAAHLFQPHQQPGDGWSIPASLGAQRVHPGRQTVTITGDGCFLMSAMEIATAGREGLPVKFFVLDDQAFHYMQTIQKSAYVRTTATILTRLDYAALAKGFGVAYQE